MIGKTSGVVREICFLDQIPHTHPYKTPVISLSFLVPVITPVYFSNLLPPKKFHPPPNFYHRNTQKNNVQSLSTPLSVYFLLSKKIRKKTIIYCLNTVVFLYYYITETKNYGKSLSFLPTTKSTKKMKEINGYYCLCIDIFMARSLCSLTRGFVWVSMGDLIWKSYFSNYSGYHHILH